jgi:hypothetical protein
MKHCICILLTAILLIFSFTANSQKPGKSFSFGVGVEGSVPLGNSANLYQYGGGVTVRFSIHAGPGFATIASGAEIFVPWQIGNIGTKVAAQIPIEAGYKFIFLRHFFVMGELGYSYFRYYSEGNYSNLVIVNSGGFSYGPSAGVQLGSLELRIKYETIELNYGNLNVLAFRLGFNF